MRYCTFRIEIDTLLAFAKWEIENGSSRLERVAQNKYNAVRSADAASRVIERSLSVIV